MATRAITVALVIVIGITIGALVFLALLPFVTDHRAHLHWFWLPYGIYPGVLRPRRCTTSDPRA